MKQFCRDIAITLALVTIVVLGLEVQTRLSYSDNRFSFKYRYMETNASKIKTLLLGHSLFEESFNSNVLGDSTFNLAICGRVSFYDVRLLEKYLDSMVNLKVVLFPIHYALDNPCDYFGDRQGKETYVYHYYKYMKIETPGSMRLYYLPKLTYQWEKKHSGMMPGVADSVDNSGYAKLSDYKGKIYPPSKRRYTQAYSETFCNNLRIIAQMCYDRQIRFIAVTPPVTDVYLSYTNQDGIRLLYDIVEQVRKDYPIEYHNYLEDPSFRSDSLYYDSSHLNHNGATLFARRVKEDFAL